MTQRKIVVSERDNIAAIFEDDRASEFIIHRGDTLLGDVYLATVENILPSIDAAFVNVGGDKMGFLHSSDIAGKGDLKSRLKPKQQILVQVMKEPTGHKGPRVTMNISLPGRFLVLMPDSRGISISRKIESNEERSRLKSIVSLLKPAGIGVIIRTEAETQKDADIQDDIETLLERWQNIVATADTAQPPTLLYRDQDLLYRVIREAVTEDTQEIIVDSAFGQQRATQLLQNWNMERGIKVSHFSGSQPILVATGVDREIKLALQTRVPMPSGGYLYIQTTEALTVVDVNSGKFTSLESQAETIRLTNLEASKEIARQLRLRNIGGMIIVDFIDMESRADKLSILTAFEKELAPDKAKPQMGQLTDLGLVEMTRHRQGQSLSEIFTKRCSACNGNGHAIEDFNWSPVFDHEHRHGAAPRQGRSSYTQGGRQQGKFQYQQKRSSRFSSSPAAQQQNRLAIAKMTELAHAHINQLQEPSQASVDFLTWRKGPVKPSAPPHSHHSGGKSGPKHQRGPQKGPSQGEDRQWDESFKERIFQLLGFRFSHIVKVSYRPPMANSVLSRINPKSNDIVCLVDSIEGMAMGHQVPDLDDVDDLDDVSEEEDDETVVEGSGRDGSESDDDSGDEGSDMDFTPDESGESESLDNDNDDFELLSDESSDSDNKKDNRSRISKPRRGRPPKQSASMDSNEDKPKRRRGRPPKKVVTTSSDNTMEQSADDGSDHHSSPTDGEEVRSPAATTNAEV